MPSESLVSIFHTFASKRRPAVLAALLACLTALVLACMAPGYARASYFSDVPEGEWYATWVDQAFDQGLMSGYTDANDELTGFFGPDDELTRAQVVMVLWRMAGMPGIHEGSLFDDVEFGAWYEAAVDWCVEAGVVTGYTSGVDEGCFRPDRPVSRQELAVMAWRYAEWAGMDATEPDPVPLESTTDWESADSWALEALTWTAATGVLSGFDNQDGTKSIKPFGAATRAQAAKVFVMFSDQPSLPEPDKKPADGAESGGGDSGDTHDKPAYAVLYADGLLSLQRGDDADPAHGEVLGSWEWDGMSSPWYEQRDSVRSVVVRDAVCARGGGVFRGLANCTSMDLARLDVLGTTLLDSMFRSCASLDTLDLSSWDTSGVENFSCMFEGCSSLRELNLAGFDTSRALDLSWMFSGCSALKTVDVAGWDVHRAESLSAMFRDCTLLETLDLSDWDVSSALYLASMFRDCTALTSLNVSTWDVSGAIDCSHMFDGCTSLDPGDIPSWDAPTEVDKGGKFADASEGESEDPSAEPTPDEGPADEHVTSDEISADGFATFNEGLVDELATLDEGLVDGPAALDGDFADEPASSGEGDLAPAVLELGEKPVSALAALAA